MKKPTGFVSGRMRRRALGTGLVAAAMLIAGAPPGGASEKLLREAVSSDKTLGEVGTRVQALRDYQEESQVFSADELRQSDEQGQSIGTVRNRNVRTIIQELSATRGANADPRAHYRNAQAQYEEAVRLLRELLRRQQQGVGESMAKYQLLEEQKKLLDETRAFKDALDRKPDATQDDIEQAVDLAGNQEQLKKNNQDAALGPMMQQAEDKLLAMRPDEAIRRQEEIVRALEDQIRQETANNPSAELAQLNQDLQALQQMMDELGKMDQQLGEMQQNPAQADNEAIQAMAMRENQMAQQMRRQDAEQTQQAAQDMDQAVENTVQEQFDPARQDVQKAKGQLQQRQQQLAQQAEKLRQQLAQQQAPPQTEQGGESPEQPGAVTPGERQGAAVQKDWQARLPERERSALLAARQAKYDPRMSEEVKRYFVELTR